jgi:hypothetical protein
MKSLAVLAAALLGTVMMAPAAEARPRGFHGHHYSFYGHHHRVRGYRSAGFRGFHRVGYRRYGHRRYSYRSYGYRRGYRSVAAATGFGLGLAAAAIRAVTYPGAYYAPRPYYRSYGYAPARYGWHGYRPVAYGGYYRPVYGGYYGWGY